MTTSNAVAGIGRTVALLIGGSAALVAQATTDVGAAMADRVRVRVEGARGGFVGQPITVTVRFELEQQFRADHAVALLQRPVDLPVQLVLPWTRDRDPERVRVAIGEAARGPTVTVDDQVVQALPLEPVTRDGRTFDVFAVNVRWIGLVADDFECAGTALRYAYTSRFEDTLLSGRQPVDRREGVAVAPDFTLTVTPLPTDAPAGFAGAIGDFEVALAAAVDRVELGDSFELALTVRGAGNLTECDAPPWPQLDGFAVQGVVERRRDGECVFAFDVLALREGPAALALDFVFFAPADGRYRTVTTAPVNVTVVPRSAERPLPPRVARLVAREPAAGGAGAAGAWDIGAVALPVSIVVVVFAILAAAIGLSRRRKPPPAAG